ncbi:response regulator [Thalassotalea euphylliae]|uniref:Response regulator n=1 Tax=Thalassotalea euphylliae TaxID=1655234 RepID=A0A3E0TMY8_9GAMM|nr:MinD/ParA family protein [Thalassotalea euphylliae]REL25951.1 response regulator [Thalassotalea euphylliae]
MSVTHQTFTHVAQESASTAEQSVASKEQAMASNIELLAFIDDQTSLLAIEKLLASYALLASDKSKVLAGNLNSAVQYLSQQASPQVLLVDISAERDPLTRMSELANVCQPDTRVILLGTDNSIDLYRAFKNLGIDDYLTKPINHQQLADVIGQAFGQASSKERSAQQLVFTGCGGGVGVSTLVANISRGLAAKGAQTLAADLNSYGGDLDLLLGANAGFGLMNLLSGQQQVDKLFIERSCSQVAERLFLLKSLSQQQTFDASSYQRLAKQLGQHYNYLVWDLASQLFAVPGMLDVWLAADTKVLVCQPSLAGLRQAKAILNLTSDRQYGQRLILVLNYIHPHKEIMLSVEEMTRQLGQPFDHILPYAPKAVTQAADLGSSLLTANNPFSRALAELLADIWGQGQVAKPSLLARLRKRF